MSATFVATRRRTRVRFGIVAMLFLVTAIVGPWLTDADPFEFGFPLGQPPSSTYWLGTTSSGQDVYAQFVYGLRASFFVGAVAALVAGVLGMTIGFIGGYLGARFGRKLSPTVLRVFIVVIGSVALVKILLFD